MLDVVQRAVRAVRPSQMQPPASTHDAFQADDAGAAVLPALELPPAPFSRGTIAAAPATVARPAPVAATMAPTNERADADADAFADSLPSGTSIQDLIGALTIDGVDVAAGESRPHHEFSTAVERRGARERRRAHRSTPDRRAFTSAHMAAPAEGPDDPRPVAPPPHDAGGRPSPIDAVMPPLPLALEPALPYELPSKGVAHATRRSTRASVAVTELPFPQQAIEHPPQPDTAPEPPVAPQFPEVPPAPEPVSISSIFSGAASVPVGHLVPRPADEIPVVAVPDAGPAGPSPAPGEGMDPVAAAVAAAPSAWYGGSVRVDDAMMIWNAPGTDAPLAPTVASMIAPAPPVMSHAMPELSGASAPGRAVATTPLLPGAAPAATRARGGSGITNLLLVGGAAIAGTTIAFAIDRLLL